VISERDDSRSYIRDVSENTDGAVARAGIGPFSHLDPSAACYGCSSCTTPCRSPVTSTACHRRHPCGMRILSGFLVVSWCCDPHGGRLQGFEAEMAQLRASTRRQADAINKRYNAAVTDALHRSESGAARSPLSLYTPLGPGPGLDRSALSFSSPQATRRADPADDSVGPAPSTVRSLADSRLSISALRRVQPDSPARSSLQSKRGSVIRFADPYEAGGGERYVGALSSLNRISGFPSQFDATAASTDCGRCASRRETVSLAAVPFRSLGTKAHFSVCGCVLTLEVFAQDEVALVTRSRPSSPTKSPSKTPAAPPRAPPALVARPAVVRPLTAAVRAQSPAPAPLPQRTSPAAAMIAGLRGKPAAGAH
jgi:hypothetical protein